MNSKVNGGKIEKGCNYQGISETFFNPPRHEVGIFFFREDPKTGTSIAEKLLKRLEKINGMNPTVS